MKIGLLVSHALHERNWIASGMARKIADKHELVILRPKELGAVGGPWRRRVREAFLLASMVAREPGSRTYRFKLGQRRPLLARMQIRAFRRLRDRGYDLEGAFRRWEARQRPVQAAVAATRGLDVLLWPSLIHTHNDEVELVKSARQGQKCHIVAAPASFDTLSCKGGFLVPPDQMLVWGEASKRHAVDYHGFKPEEVAVTGPPQFDLYHEPRKALTREIVLVAGTTVNFWADELEMIAFLRRVPFPIVHRSHPRAGGNWSWEAMLTLRDQLDSAMCVVTAFSTVSIEAALMGKPSLLVGFGASAHGGSVLDHSVYEHMAELLQWPGIILCKSMPTLCEELNHVLSGKYEMLADELRCQAFEIARSDGKCRERIVEAIERVHRTDHPA